MSAIPCPNPAVEKKRKALSYDYESSNIDYTAGTFHLVEGSHHVLCTDAEFTQWIASVSPQNR